MKILSKETINGARYCLAECPYCGTAKRIRSSNIQRTRSCGCVSAELKSKSKLKHGAYSKHFPNHDLRNACDTVSLMNCRVNSRKHPTYKRICDGLNTELRPIIEVGKEFLETWGPKPAGMTTEKVGNEYCCGECADCIAKNQSCTILGYIPHADQYLTRSTSIVFELEGVKRCLNRLGELIGKSQSRISYLWYSKFDDLETPQQKWLEIQRYFIEEECPECYETKLTKSN